MAWGWIAAVGWMVLAVPIALRLGKAIDRADRQELARPDQVPCFPPGDMRSTHRAP